VKIVFHPKAIRDLALWIDADSKHLKKLYKLIVETTRTPTSGSGNPERLRHVSGRLWSRRVTMQHRMVYAIEPDAIVFLSLHGHYWADM
jgi:toxin YoeB